jgi:HAD superfamily hydrolase (TIGR01509 family)
LILLIVCTVGVPVRDIFVILIEEATHLKVKPDIDDVCATKKKVSFQTIAEIGTPPIEAVIDIARKYHGKVPLAVASSGNREHVMASLRECGILHLFDAVVTCEDITNPKPAPDIFLLAAERIGCDPTKCRGFEDADLGMQALWAAGMQAIDVRHTPGYPRVVPSTRSVLLDDGDEEITELDGSTKSRSRANLSVKSGTGMPTDDNSDSGSGVGSFVVQMAVVAVLAYGAYVLLNQLMLDAVREEAWSED